MRFETHRKTAIFRLTHTHGVEASVCVYTIPHLLTLEDLRIAPEGGAVEVCQPLLGRRENGVQERVRDPDIDVVLRRAVDRNHDILGRVRVGDACVEVGAPGATPRRGRAPKNAHVNGRQTMHVLAICDWRRMAWNT